MTTSWYGRWRRRRQPAALTMTLAFNDSDPVATCVCGRRCFGDSINDAVLAWTKHVTSSPECREQL